MGLSWFSERLEAQSLKPSAPLLEAVSKAPIVVEGQITSETKVRKAAEGHIETLYELHVDEVFKGAIPSNSIIMFGD